MHCRSVVMGDGETSAAAPHAAHTQITVKSHHATLVVHGLMAIPSQVPSHLSLDPHPMPPTPMAMCPPRPCASPALHAPDTTRSALSLLSCPFTRRYDEALRRGATTRRYDEALRRAASRAARQSPPLPLPLNARASSVNARANSSVRIDAMPSTPESAFTGGRPFTVARSPSGATAMRLLSPSPPPPPLC